MARLSSSEVSNLILVLTNYRVVVVSFPELAMVAGLIGLCATEGKIAEMVAMMIVVVEIAALDWTWLRVHEFWLLEVRAKLIRH
jgi:hypothetical protein